MNKTETEYTGMNSATESANITVLFHHEYREFESFNREPTSTFGRLQQKSNHYLKKMMQITVSLIK